MESHINFRWAYVHSLRWSGCHKMFPTVWVDQQFIASSHPEGFVPRDAETNCSSEGSPWWKPLAKSRKALIPSPQIHWPMGVSIQNHPAIYWGTPMAMKSPTSSKVFGLCWDMLQPMQPVDCSSQGFFRPGLGSYT